MSIAEIRGLIHQAHTSADTAHLEAVVDRLDSAASPGSLDYLDARIEAHAAMLDYYASSGDTAALVRHATWLIGISRQLSPAPRSTLSRSEVTTKVNDPTDHALATDALKRKYGRSIVAAYLAQADVLVKQADANEALKLLQNGERYVVGIPDGVETLRAKEKALGGNEDRKACLTGIMWARPLTS